MKSVVIEVQSTGNVGHIFITAQAPMVTKSYVSKHYCGLSFLSTFKSFLPIKLYSISKQQTYKVCNKGQIFHYIFDQHNV